MDLQELENKAWKEGAKQKTIDLVQNAECDFNDEPYTEDGIGAYIYEVGICLEVYNPCFRVDLEILMELKTILESKYERLRSLPKKEMA